MWHGFDKYVQQRKLVIVCRRYMTHLSIYPSRTSSEERLRRMHRDMYQTQSSRHNDPLASPTYPPLLKYHIPTLPDLQAVPQSASSFHPHTSSPRKQHRLCVISIKPLHPPLPRLPTILGPRNLDVPPIPLTVAFRPHTLRRCSSREAMPWARRDVAERDRHGTVPMFGGRSSAYHRVGSCGTYEGGRFRHIVLVWGGAKEMNLCLSVLFVLFLLLSFRARAPCLVVLNADKVSCGHGIHPRLWSRWHCSS
jgi:hypothetical protein